jgi:hypothetical protein
MADCPVCGAANGTCGHQPLAFPPIGSDEARNGMADKKIYVPQQKVRRGKAGYKGDVVVIDPDTGQEIKQAAKKTKK